MTSIVKRIERAEAAAKQSHHLEHSDACICFPPDERPFLLYEPVRALAASVRCPMHGNRFEQLQPMHIHIPDWKREVEVGFRWSTASEQYRRAWNASFPAGSWAVEEIQIAGRSWLLPRSETGELLDWRSAQTAPPWKRVHAVTLEEQQRKLVESTFFIEKERSQL